ncbi:MAG: AAA family ATPase, partial [Actinomycetota bacterium]|nr:AAA family ATPase [Actinomycetota bacterium]
MASEPLVRLVPPAAPEALPTLDEQQDLAVGAVLAGSPTVVLGAPGTGKTTTALAMLVEAVRSGVPADRVVMLSPRRRSAGVLRERAAGLLGVVTRGPLVRTPTSLAFGVLRSEAISAGLPLPVLISGPEQDMLLRELLEGHLDGDGVRLDLPEGVPAEVLAQRAFRDELRDLIMRAAERGIGAPQLHELGLRHARPAWVFAASLYREYLDVVALGASTPDAGERLDPGLLVERAAEALAAWPAGDRARPGWDLVVVDDAQEATQSVGALVRVLVEQGSRFALLGDPDIAVQSHRGAVPGAFLDGFGLTDEPPLVLGRSWRQGPELREITARLGRLVRGAGTHRHHDVTPRGSESVRGASARVDAAIVGSLAQQTALVARTLREAHLLDGVPWSEMAVVARSGAQVSALR